MFIVMNSTSIILPMITLSLWTIVSLLVQSLPYSRNGYRLKMKRNVLLTAISINWLSDTLWLLLVIGTWISQGWLYVEGIIKVNIPILLFGNLSVLLFTFSQLRLLDIQNHAILSTQTQIQLMHPKLKIPVFAATLSSGMQLYLNLFAQPIQPSFFEAAFWPLMLLLMLFVPSFFVIKQHEHVLQGQAIWKPLWKRGLKSLSILGIMTSILIFILLINVMIGVFTTRLPASYDMMNHDHLDTGGKEEQIASHHHHHTEKTNQKKIEVKQLHGNISAPTDKTFTLVAQQKVMTLQSGRKINTWTYNGEIAPELRVREGDVVEVKLVNHDISKGVTIHWHGYNVPNAMDGVPGMTQNIVKPGETFVYKFRAKQVGTYWFHSHQQASEQVKKGLFGTLIVDPKNEPDPFDLDITAISHRWQTNEGKVIAFGKYDHEQKKLVQPGQKVRIRTINATNISRQHRLSGVNYRVTSIDGVPIEQPGLLSSDTSMQLAAGGRYDITFTMPNHPVRFGIESLENDKQDKMPDILFTTPAQQTKPAFSKRTKEFDPTMYGLGTNHPFTDGTKFDRQFHMILGNRMGFYNGVINYLWTINGKVFPNTPTLLVTQGEKIKVTFINRSFSEHPMHLHGHHMVVLKKNGQKVKTPWKTDTLNVQMGESYEIAFIANNPGMWMDHCHNLDHAAVGMTMHLMYDHVKSSYEVGTKSGNIPD